MIQDFSCVFEGKQAINVRKVSFRGNHLFRKIGALVLTGALVVGVLSCAVYGLLIRSGLQELEGKQAVKIDLISQQKKLYDQRSALLDKDTIKLAAADMGLYSPSKTQIRQL